MSEENTYWLVVLGLIVLVFWVMVRDNTRARNRTQQEYEQDVLNAQNSMLRAGMLELDKFAGETKQKRAAVEYLKDQDQGQTKAGGKDDDLDRTEPVAQEASSADSTEAHSPLRPASESGNSESSSVSDNKASDQRPGVGGAEDAEGRRTAGREPRV
jgi:hypothetical protein